MSDNRYPEEFKIEALKKVVDRGHSDSSVAARLDIINHHPQPLRLDKEARAGFFH